MENYYDVLHIANFAEIEIVKAAYRAITKLYHPDTNSNVDPQIIVKINLAYEVLGDETKKAEYDNQLRAYLNSNTKQNSNSSDYGRYYHVNDNMEKEETTQKSTEESKVNSTDPKKPERHVGRFTKAVTNSLSYIVNSFIEESRELQKDAENAYYEGCSFDDYTLVHKYIASLGPRRKGYSKALVDRGLLVWDCNNLVPSDTFTYLARH